MFDSYYNRVIGAESNFDPLAKNPRSSATGLGQFTNGTWGDLMQQYPDLGLTADGRTDPVQSKKALERFTADNADVLKKNGYDPTDNALYALHRFGRSGGIGILGADPSTPISSLVSPEVLAANPDLNGKTAGQVTNRWSDGGSAPQRGPLNFGPAPQLAQNGPATILPPKSGGGSTSGYSFDNFASNAPDAFMGAGAALASISSPQQGAALAQLAAQNRKDGFTMHADPQTGAVFRINTKTGQIDRVGGLPYRTEGDKAYDIAMGKHWADLNEKISTTAANSQTSLGQLDALKGALSNPNVYQGFGGESVLQLKKAAQAVGFDVQGIPDSELAGKISKGLALELRNPTGGAGMPGALSDSDRKYLTQMVAGLENSPQGNTQILELYRAVHQRNIDIDKLRADYEAQHGRLDAGFTRQVRDFAQTNPLFKGGVAASSPAAAAPANRPPLSSIFK